MSDLTTILRDAGVTYRQFDYWVTQGWIDGFGDDRNPGMGFARAIDAGQVKQLRVMAGLVKDGVRPDVAAALTRQILAGETPKLGGFVLVPAHQAVES